MGWGWDGIYGNYTCRTILGKTPLDGLLVLMYLYIVRYYYCNIVFGGKTRLIEVHSDRIAEYLNSNSNNTRYPVLLYLLPAISGTVHIRSYGLQFEGLQGHRHLGTSSAGPRLPAQSVTPRGTRRSPWCNMMYAARREGRVPSCMLGSLPPCRRS